MSQDLFAVALGPRRGLSDGQQAEARLARMSPDERHRREELEEELRRDREEQQARTEKGQRVRVAILNALGSKKEPWNAEALREAARARLDPADHDWVSVMLLQMCGDGGPLALTSKLLVCRAP
jgi:hypothetical protein